MGYIVDEWKKYVELVYVKSKISLTDVPYMELKNAYHAGFSSALILVDKLINDLDDKKAIEDLKEIKKEILEYWDTQRKNMGKL